MKRLAILTLAVLALAACGGRVARPIPAINSFDDALSCTHLAGEFDNNLARLSELTGERRAKVADNVGMLLASPLFLDLSQAQQTEASAIDARNARLVELMANQNCPPPPTETP
jgi:hypothetical protein